MSREEDMKLMSKCIADAIKVRQDSGIPSILNVSSISVELYRSRHPRYHPIYYMMSDN